MAVRRASPQLGRMSRNMVRASGREPRGRIYRNRPRRKTRRGEPDRAWAASALGEFRDAPSPRRYPLWRKDSHPAGLVPRRELECLSRRLNAVRTNGSFCSRQQPKQTWLDGTPPPNFDAPGPPALGALTPGPLALGAPRSGTLALGALRSGPLASGALRSGVVARGALRPGVLAFGALGSGPLAFSAPRSDPLTFGALTLRALASGPCWSGVLASHRSPDDQTVEPLSHPQ